MLDAPPEAIRGFADQSLPGELDAFYRRAFIDELLAKQVFSGRLEPLKGNAEIVWEIACAENPLPQAPQAMPVELPEMVGAGTRATRLGNIACANRFALHRQTSTTVIERLVKRYIGMARRTEPREDEPEDEEQPDPDNRLSTRFPRHIQNTTLV